MSSILVATLSFLLIDAPLNTAHQHLIMVTEESSLYTTLKEIIFLAKSIPSNQLKLPALSCFEKLLNKKFIIASYRLIFDALEEAAIVLRSFDHHQTPLTNLEALVLSLSYCCNELNDKNYSRGISFILTEPAPAKALSHE